MLFNYIAKLGVYTVLIHLFVGIIYITSFNDAIQLFGANFFTTMTYLSLLLWTSQQKIKINTSALLVIVIFHNLFFVGLYNTLYFFDHESFFAYSAVDSLQYDHIAKNMSGTSLVNSLAFIPQNWDIDDYGFPVFVSLVYRMVASPLAVNFCNVIFNAVTIYFMYQIGRSFLNKKYAQISAMVFGISTYSVFFMTSGLKETLMILLITGSFHYYFMYVRSNNYVYLVVSLAWCLSVFFFRVPLVYFVIISILVSEFIRLDFVKKLFKLKINRKLLFIISIIVPTTIILLYLKYHLLLKYRSDIILIGATKHSEFSNYSYLFVYLNSIVAAFLGPLPTVVTVSKNLNLSVLSGSLIIRVFLGIFFIIGILNAGKTRAIVPLAVFCLMEMGILSIILHAFEVRKCYPHYPFMILIAVYGLQQMHQNADRYYFTSKVIKLYNPTIFFIILFWNYLRLR